MRKMKSNDTLTSPSKMYQAGGGGAPRRWPWTPSIDSINKLKDMGLELGKLDMKNMTFITVPVVDNPAEKVKATVVLDKSSAPTVFQMIRDDVSFTAVKQQAAASKNAAAKAAAARLKGPQSAASEVRVQVINGGAAPGSAQETLTWLQNDEGVTKSENAGNAPAALAKTTLEYAPDQAAQARKLAAVMGLPGTALKPGKSVRTRRVCRP